MDISQLGAVNVALMVNVAVLVSALRTFAENPAKLTDNAAISTGLMNFIILYSPPVIYRGNVKAPTDTNSQRYTAKGCQQR